MLLMSTLAGVPYKRYAVEGAFDAIVIGSGIGGLAAAALMARHAGKRVLVLERHYTAGGFTHVFHRPGWEWDVGVHYVGQVGDPRSQVRAMFDEITEGRLTWNAMPDVYDRIRIADRSYDFVTGAERFRERMQEYFPGERQAVARYVQQVRDAAGASAMYFAEKALPAALASLAGPLLRRRFLRHARQTTMGAIERLTGNRELVAALTGHWGNYGLPPGASSFGIHAIIAEHYFDGGFYPVGGASRIAASIEPAIERAGGKILVGAEVAGILVDARNRAAGVRMADGQELRAPVVMSDAGAWNTFARLLPECAGGRAEALADIERIPGSMSHLCLYVGLRRGPTDPEFGGANLWIYPDADHDANVARFGADPEQPFPCLFISFPSAKDPTFAKRYPGRATIEVITLVPYGWFERWQDTRWKRRGADYDAFKQRLAERLRGELERHVPAVRGKIEYCELSTPLTTRHFANFQRGEIYGLSATPERFRVRWLGPRTPVQNLYLTGADAAVPGVTGAMFGGALAASAVLRRNLVGGVARREAA
jgi:all-trans-retinol 13,14-reductase